MAEQLVDRILREIRDHMTASRAAVEESRRLEAALAALEREGNGKRVTALPSRRTKGPEKSSSKRAARGENLRRIREAIGERPGATAGELAAATGIARPTVASTLGKLVRNGEFERSELPGGRVGFRRSRAASEATVRGDATSCGSQTEVTESA